MANGRFITFEGADGSGKSTQAALLADGLRKSGIDAVLTREPGGAPGAEEIRTLLVEGGIERWSAMAEVLLHYAARVEHMAHTIRPALEQGKWVVSDRFADSTMAYQGYGHQLGRQAVERVHRAVIGDFAPDLTLVLDAPVEAGLKRAASRSGIEDRYERMDRDFHVRLAEGFLDIARREPDRCVIVDGTGTIEEIQQSIRRLVGERLGADLR
ncbi:MAG: dTMP kinase [Rhodospirillales bacterium RIFCSPLOWO2_12_FULL_58_28]|nr:MAG: dTMP kinase [Rhodospirillales bacterium RIFCSPLOWO2_02_FULL_58_16]OHC77566.1 MAG: dTMP kinase [Rhodospirillales bacterium RIFCSPLOWO2_12_FULL_58_28]